MIEYEMRHGSSSVMQVNFVDELPVKQDMLDFIFKNMENETIFLGCMDVLGLKSKLVRKVVVKRE